MPNFSRKKGKSKKRIKRKDVILGEIIRIGRLVGIWMKKGRDCCLVVKREWSGGSFGFIWMSELKFAIGDFF